MKTFISFSGEARETYAVQFMNFFNKYGLHCWYDYHELFLGDELKKSIVDNGINKVDYCILIINKTYLNRNWPCQEALLLYNRFIKKKDIVIFPILLDITKQDLQASKLSFLLNIKYQFLKTGELIDKIAFQIINRIFHDFLSNFKFKSVSSALNYFVSVFKVIQDLLAPSKVKGLSQFKLLLNKLSPEHKARWFAGSALNSGEQSMLSVMSTAMSRLNTFLDTELEQILCFDTEIDAERFCKEKSAIFIVMPEEDNSKYFMVSLILQQLYREILSVADEKGGKLDNRVMMYLDEFGTLPKIESAEMMFSASRSRKVSIVPIIQSFAQLNKNYGAEGAEIITDNTQLTIFGGFAPNSKSAEVLSKAMGSKTVMSGSVSRGKNDPSQSLQMIERALMTPDELKSMPKGQFIVMKTGHNPMKVKLKLFFKWGIQFEKPFSIGERSVQTVKYLNKAQLESQINDDYNCGLSDDEVRNHLEYANNERKAIKHKDNVIKDEKSSSDGFREPEPTHSNIPSPKINNVK